MKDKVRQEQIEKNETQIQELKKELMQKTMDLESEVYSKGLIQKQQQNVKLKEGHYKMENRDLKIKLKDEKQKTDHLNRKAMDLQEEKKLLTSKYQSMKDSFEKIEKQLKTLQSSRSYGNYDRGGNYISAKVDMGGSKWFSNKLFNNNNSRLQKIKEEEEKGDENSAVNSGRTSDGLLKGKRDFTASILSGKKGKGRIGPDTSTLLGMNKPLLTHDKSASSVPRRSVNIAGLPGQSTTTTTSTEIRK